MMSELSPCPFCGGTDVKIAKRDVEPQGDPWYGQKVERIVECNSCGATKFDRYWHEGFVDDESAIAAWNTRTPSAEQKVGEFNLPNNLPLTREQIEQTELFKLAFAWVTAVANRCWHKHSRESYMAAYNAEQTAKIAFMTALPAPPTAEQKVGHTPNRINDGYTPKSIPETIHARNCAYVTSDGPAPCTCPAGDAAALPAPPTASER